MRCAACEHESPAGSAFCEGCGARLERTCGTCGAIASPVARFCRSCGAALGPIDPPAPAPAPARATPVERTPRAYTPKQLAEKILQAKSALEGERKQVTVLFADVKGSMELAGQLDPDHRSAVHSVERGDARGRSDRIAGLECGSTRTPHDRERRLRGR